MNTIEKETFIHTNEKLNKGKENKTFLLLSVFGIIFVVLGHCKNISVFLNNIFPYYSFHMPLFAFISGYFFKNRKIIEFLKVKVKKLIIPYFIWNIIYGVIVNILKYFNIIKYGKEFSIFNIFIAPFYGNSNQFVFNIAAWFVISIFFVQLIYILMNKVMSKLKITTEILVVALSIIIAYFELKLVKQGYNYGIWYLITRVSFLMPFYAIGQVYKRFEQYEIKNNIFYFILIIMIQCILLQRYNLSYNLNLLEFNNSFLVYLVGSMTGILFWLRVSKILSIYIGENKMVNYIGNNTYTIMMHHVFIYFLINTSILILHKLMGIFGKFNYNSYQNTVWYFYNNNNAAMLLLYVILAIAIPLLVKKILLICNNKFKMKTVIKN